MVAAHIQGRLHDLEKIRAWERNPQVYGEILGASLAAQALFDYAPQPERARRVLSKLRQAPRLIQAARDNVKEPPGIFVKNGLETLRGTLRFIETDLPRAFADVDDLRLLGDLADAQTEAIDALKSLHGLPRDGPRAEGARLVPPRRRPVRRQAQVRRGHRHPAQPPARHRAARAQPHAGGVPQGRVAHRGRRSDRGLAQGQGPHPRPPTASSRRRARRSSSSRSSSNAATWSRCRRASRSWWRRRRTSSAGRSRACGRRGRSRRGRRARTTT